MIRKIRKTEKALSEGTMSLKDGVYYLYKYSTGEEIFIVMYLLPKDSGIYESSYEDEAEEPEDPVNPPAPQKKAVPSLSITSADLKAGDTLQLRVIGGKVTKWTSSKSKRVSVSNGKVKALRKGSAVIAAKLDSGKTLKCSIKVTTSPKLSKKSITVKKGKSKTVTVTGKAPGVKNVYKNTRRAKVTSKSTVLH